MKSRGVRTLCVAGLFAGVAWVNCVALTPVARGAENKEVWIDPSDPSLPADYKVQGEYAGQIGGGDKLGAQVIALGKSAFQAVVYPGGLPGDGWDGKNKILLSGKQDGDKALSLKPAEGNRSYMAQSPEQFSATSKYPSPGQKAYTAEISADGSALTGKTDDGKTFELKKTVRKSPTLGAKAPEGAVILFDGSNTDEWNNGHLDSKEKALNTEHGDAITKKKFKNYTAHLEFFLPYRPDARSQGRANSGFYQVDHYEVQILDSFGLDGKNNECGGVYTKAEPSVNMCLPPLTWQTYDVEFTAPETDASGKKTKNARLTLKHNGVTVHDNIEINGPTGGARSEPEGTPGPLKIQGHGNPVLYRNIWVAEKK